MKIVWTEPAVADLHELHAYIARDSESYASRFVEKIISSVTILIDHPRLGRVVPEADQENIRELLYYNYRIIYRVAPDRIELLSVIHGARNLAAGTPPPWDLA
jgi:toxin ParE1/3/4